ncbi:hypothetical protein MSG28_012598 [Choristoneura fumiferana]|uniref:Uncharacterized protein n=1 Tax=Choristoneura fumiferana TaxID=7141 RepID=A0ACC0JH98_CHOFU|nr:hypothetical protein MSG28_012598 [Choristoneura fumiferana]
MEVDDGPMYLKTAKTEQEACEKTWWLALLMVGNYVHTDAMTTSFLSAGVGITLIGVVLSTGVLCFTYHVMGPLAWVYLTLDRTIFAVALLIVIVFCTYGDVRAGRAPLRSASPLRCDAEPLAQGCAMAAGAGGDSLRDRLRGGRCPAPSSPESVEARLAERPRRAAPSAELTVARAASASAGAADRPTPRRRLRHSDVTTDRYAPPALNGPSPFVRHDKLRFSIVPFDEYALSASQNWITDSGTRFRYEPGGSLVEFAAYTKIS